MALIHRNASGDFQINDFEDNDLDFTAGDMGDPWHGGIVLMVLFKFKLCYINMFLVYKFNNETLMCILLQSILLWNE